jgi:hypothetical protein
MMKQFRRPFLAWFVSLLALFAFLNLPDFHGSKVHRIGFPCPIAEWVEMGDYRSETEFYLSAIFMNIALAVGISAVIALVCGLARAYSQGKKNEIAKVVDSGEEKNEKEKTMTDGSE